MILQQLYKITWTQNHVPMDKSTKVSKDTGSCLNVAQETHEATFTFGLGGNRPGDEALYNALSAEGKLDFDNENVKYAYKEI